MATEKKNEIERSVEERLQNLYELQTLLSEIDRIKKLRGELPNEVKNLEDEIARFQTRIQNYKNEITDQKDFINKSKATIAEKNADIAKYDEQINNVRNNREFAFLEKEKEYAGLEIQLAEKKITQAENNIALKEEEIAKSEAELADNRQTLEEKKKELDDIISETRIEEENIMSKAKVLEQKIDPYTLAAFKRIRKNARNGLGIVTVQRNACGGCFNRVPPQRQLEIKMHRKVIVCEYCGRIMVDGNLVGVNTEPAPEQSAPKTVRKRAAKATSQAVIEKIEESLED